MTAPRDAVEWKAMPWALYASCTGCGEVQHCHGKTRDGMLCLACFGLAHNNPNRRRPHVKPRRLSAA